MICGAIRGLRNRGDTPPCPTEGWWRRALHDRAMMQPDGSSARDHIPRANWRSFVPPQIAAILGTTRHCVVPNMARSEEHTSELQSLIRKSYAVLCLKTKT